MNGHDPTSQIAQAALRANAAAIAVPIPPGPTNTPNVLVRSCVRDEATFQLKGVDMAYANAVRRVMMADVPTVGEWILGLVWRGGEGEGERWEARWM